MPSDAPDDFAERVAAMTIEPLADAVAHLQRDLRVDEVGGAYLYG